MPTDHLFRKGGIWYCWLYLSDGTRIRRSTKQTDRRAAAKVLRRLEREAHGAASLPGDAPRATVAETLSELLANSFDVAQATAMNRVKELLAEESSK